SHERSDEAPDDHLDGDASAVAHRGHLRDELQEEHARARVGVRLSLRARPHALRRDRDPRVVPREEVAVTQPARRAVIAIAAPSASAPGGTSTIPRPGSPPCAKRAPARKPSGRRTSAASRLADAAGVAAFGRARTTSAKTTLISDTSV